MNAKMENMKEKIHARMERMNEKMVMMNTKIDKQKHDNH